LYHRLKVVTINLPRLADRREDIPLLVDYFVKEHSKAASENVRVSRRPLAGVCWRSTGQ